jgi:predicted RNA-binding Zn-ribbon protein involved in translation (DUF1610 family)
MNGLADFPPVPFPRCEKCREHLDEGDLFCPTCGHEAPCSAEQAHEPAGRVLVHRFECTGCGASLTWELEIQGLRCAFCGRETLEERETVSVPPPRLIVPFQIDRPRAETLFRESVGRGFFRPGDLLRELVVKEMRGVYLPFWSFSADCHFYWTADSDATPQGSKAEWAPRFGEHDVWYEHLLIPASGALTTYETHRLGNWDPAQAVAWAPELVRDVPTEAFSITRKKARPQALAELEKRVQADSLPKIPGRHRNVRVNPLYTKLEAWPLLVPAWIMAYEYRGRRYRFLVNGQTGKIEGNAPLSPWRLAAAAALVVLVFVLLVWLSGK